MSSRWTSQIKYLFLATLYRRLGSNRLSSGGSTHATGRSLPFPDQVPNPMFRHGGRIPIRYQINLGSIDTSQRQASCSTRYEWQSPQKFRRGRMRFPKDRKNHGKGQAKWVPHTSRDACRVVMSRVCANPSELPPPSPRRWTFAESFISRERKDYRNGKPDNCYVSIIDNHSSNYKSVRLD